MVASLTPSRYSAPNVTGVLHMGHMLNNTIQDILVRRARMEGKNACWYAMACFHRHRSQRCAELAAQGIKKTDLTRDEFLKHAWEWNGRARWHHPEQLRKLGASCDWDRTAFTMDEKRSESVIKVFVDLYNKGLIYRGCAYGELGPESPHRPQRRRGYRIGRAQQAVLSNNYVADDGTCPVTGAEGEVVHRDASGKRYAVVATTRPETIMGDTAMCINPADPKNQWPKGKESDCAAGEPRYSCYPG